MFKKVLLAFTLLIPAFVAPGQDTASYKWVTTLNYHYGFLVAHRPMVIPLQQNHMHGMEFSVALRPNGTREWHHAFNFPEMGLTTAFWNFGNDRQLGTGISVIPYLDFPLSNGKRTQLKLKFGWGIGYVEKIFNADDNYKNVAIGSHLNCALTLQPHFVTKITARISLNGGLAISHFSNGSIATPNLGLNVLTVTGGLAYKFIPQTISPQNTVPFVKNRRFEFFAAAGIKQIYPADGKTYYPLSISSDYKWQQSRKSAFGLGLDIFYDNSIFQKLEERDMELHNDLEAFKVGIHGSYELTISDLSILLNLGGYLYNKLSNDGSFYQRVGLRYRLNERIFVLMHLKSHWGKADFIEWGVGYRLDKLRTK